MEPASLGSSSRASGLCWVCNSLFCKGHTASLSLSRLLTFFWLDIMSCKDHVPAWSWEKASSFDHPRYAADVNVLVLTQFVNLLYYWDWCCCFCLGGIFVLSAKEVLCTGTANARWHLDIHSPFVFLPHTAPVIGWSSFLIVQTHLATRTSFWRQWQRKRKKGMTDIHHQGCSV